MCAHVLDQRYGKMNLPLFRKEVLQARRTSWLGGISLVQPVSAWGLTALSVIVAISVVLFLCVGTYTHRATVVGQLVPTRGLATVMAPATGVVTSLSIREGQEVKIDQILAVITVPRTTLASGDTESALESRLIERSLGVASSLSARLEQFDAQTRGLSMQLSDARLELTHIDKEVATRQKQIALSNEVLDRYRKLQDDKYVSVLQIRQQEASALEYTSDMQALQRAALDQRREIAQLEQQLRTLPGQRAGARAEYRRDSAALGQERVQNQINSGLVVTAPIEGVVATQLAKPGQAVSSGQPLLSLLPVDSKLEAELLVPSRAIGFVEPGDAVMLRYQAFPYQKFGSQQGRVKSISRSALSASEQNALEGNLKQGEPLYRVTVSILRQRIRTGSSQESLKPGMVLDADILGEKRRLIEWVLEPLYSLQRNLDS